MVVWLVHLFPGIMEIWLGYSAHLSGFSSTGRAAGTRRRKHWLLYPAESESESYLRPRLCCASHASSRVNGKTLGGQLLVWHAASRGSDELRWQTYSAQWVDYLRVCGDSHAI